MTELLSTALQFNSLFQIVALLIIVAFFVLLGVICYYCLKLICWVISRFSKVNFSGEHNDTHFQVHLRR